MTHILREEVLHFIWRSHRFDTQNLTTLHGSPLHIENFGHYNTNAGPDFTDGIVTIGDTKWIGHIEIHVKASDWNRHGHSSDPAYRNVILHVVHDADIDIYAENGIAIPTLELRNRIDPGILRNYERLKKNLSGIPCEKSIHNVPGVVIRTAIERSTVDRLETKCRKIAILLHALQNNWEEALHTCLLKYLGLKINGEAFEHLARLLPFKILKKHTGNQNQMEALLLGQSGMLGQRNDTYTHKLDREYQYLKTKYKLSPMTGVEWKFLRLRPSNFPTVRMAQVAALYHQHPRLFHKIIHYDSHQELISLFRVTASEYWDTHYIPGRISRFRPKKIGITAVRNLLINVVVPVLFHYGNSRGDSLIREKALALLSEIRPEKNVITDRWRRAGIRINSAFDSQGLIQLKTISCDKFKCLQCPVGSHILTR